MTNILKKIPQCVWLFFVFLTVLNGCGNADQKNGRETAMAEQNQQKAFTDVGTEENPETEETQIREQDTEDSETEEDGENGLLKGVTWEDFNDGVGAPVLHFSFNNGTIVDKKLLYLGIIQDIQYIDITGDGTDEIVVYTDMINTIRDGFTLIDFFRIEGDTVVDISPVFDIPELEDTAWCMEISQELLNGYTIVLDLESYEKVEGVPYIDCIMQIGFDGSGWEAISKQERPEG